MAKLKVEIADEPYALSRGLMFRDELEKGSGMLFKFPMILEASFWGKNTYIPLDIAFIDTDNRITGIKNIVPMSTRAVRSDGTCKMALEVNAGFFNDNKICSGHRVEIIKDADGSEIEIIFHKN